MAHPPLWCSGPGDTAKQPARQGSNGVADAGLIHRNGGRTNVQCRCSSCRVDVRQC